MDLTKPNKPAPRTALSLSVDLRRNYGRVSLPGAIKNLSLTGAFINHSTAIDNGSTVQIQISINGRKRQIPARVIWQNSSGCGVQFILRKKQDHIFISDLVEIAELKKENTKAVLHSIFKVV